MVNEQNMILALEEHLDAQGPIAEAVGYEP